MSITVACPKCGKNLKAPDSAAGKKGRCPDCGEVITLIASPAISEEPIDPEIVEPEVVPSDYSPVTVGSASRSSADTETSSEDRRPCPACGEMISKKAMKCRFCGEIFDPTLKAAQKKKSSGSSGSDDDNLGAGEWVLAVLCSGIGCIMGIIWMIQGKPKGLKMIGASIVCGILGRVIIALLLHQN